MKKIPRKNIIIKGARVNNLKNISLEIPRDQLVVVTGLSGSGKSSLVFDVIYAEGNRRYMESLSSYLYNFLDIAARPDVDKIENLSPLISIDQKSVTRNSRSTVGTLTEAYDYLRILFTQIGIPHCPICGRPLKKKSILEIFEEIKSWSAKTAVAILFELGTSGENFSEILKKIGHLGYTRVRYGGKIITITEAELLITKEEKITTPVGVVVDRFIWDPRQVDKERIEDSLKTAFKMGKGSLMIILNEKKELRYDENFVCSDCGITLKEINPRHFSFNNPEGACETCQGLGKIMDIDPDLLIPNKKLSLEEGAVRFWGNVGGRMSKEDLNQLKNLAKRKNFSLKVPVGKLTAHILNCLLYGEEIESGNEKNSEKKYPGIIPSLLKKYAQTKSNYFRTETEKYMISRVCPSCGGKRLKKEYLNVLIGGRSIDDFCAMEVSALRRHLENFLSDELDEEKKKIAREIVKEIKERLLALEEVGLGYLSLSRGSETLSGGEAQRVRLAVQIKSHLMGIIYVLDEPSIGLHPYDTEKLIKNIRSLRDAGNSLIVVEHDRDFIRSADWVIDMGPGAGEDGGRVIFQGTPKKLERFHTDTAKYLTGKKKVYEKSKRKLSKNYFLEIIGATENNLKNIDVKIPLKKLVVVCGVSGSGKSTLFNDILAKALSRHFYRSKEQPGKHKSISGLEWLDKVINITQDPIGRTPRSNVATYTGVFFHIRELFSQTDQARRRGYNPSRFSFNVKGGRCEVCQGAGVKKVEMQLLPEMYIPCEVCGGSRYNRKTLEIEYQGADIAAVLDMSVSYAAGFFKNHPLIYEKLKMMEKVGLGYLKLGQSAVNLSGGEAQRIKLATELARKTTGNTLYILDEPTIGLHFEDTRRLLKVLAALVDKGNSVLVIEHNPDVIAGADWVIEMGDEGGVNGGRIIFEGTPENLKKGKTPTAKYI